MKKGIVLAVMCFMLLVGLVFAQARFMGQGSVNVNPYTPQSITLRFVKGLFIYSPDVNYKVSFDGKKYIPMNKGGAFNFSNVNFHSITVYFQGNTSSDTGIVYYIYQN